MTNSKTIVHELYNEISTENHRDMEELKEVLLKVYNKLDRVSDDVPLINRLTNYIFFKGLTNHLFFSKKENELIRELSEIGGKAGLNGSYRADYGDLSQFD